ncbi:MAG: hypothetical protein J6B04_04235 [Clostridia bacterium]|nr:hypothetical protein [Clostridia bacterium]
MAKTKKFQFETAGFTFTNRVIKLHKSKRIYRKANLFLANELLAGGVDAGSSMQRFLQCGVREEKIALGKEVIANVDKTVYVISIMEANKIYKASKVKPVLKFAAALKQAVAEKVKVLSTPVIVNKPGETIVPDPIVVKKYAAPEIIPDEDGFNEDYIEVEEE